VSSKHLPYALHLPGLGSNPASEAVFRKVIARRQKIHFQSVVILNEIGAQYEKAQKYLSRMGIDAFVLQGGTCRLSKIPRRPVAFLEAAQQQDEVGQQLQALRGES